MPKSGVTIEGAGAAGPTATRLVASDAWPLTPEVGPGEESGDERREYLIALNRVQGVTVRGLALSSPATRPITGGVHCRDGKAVALEDLVVRDFRWNGLRLEFSEGVTVARCLIENASRTKKKNGQEGGLIRTRWLKACRFTGNRIVSTVGNGYGYKGGGHEGVRLDHNVIDTAYFAVESAFESEYGLEIDHNHLTRCISVPKPGPGENPKARGYDYAVWIHHNLLTDSDTVEGPRNHLRLSDNHILIDKPGGRVYTHHGGNCPGPVSIDHNVIEGVDRAVVWMNEGRADGISLVHNTITCADAKDRADFLVSAYSADRIRDWVVRNNVIVAPDAQPRKLFPTERGVPTRITATHNLLVNVTGAPDGNFPGAKPGFRGVGAKPWPFYQSADASFCLDRGTKLPPPFWGKPFEVRGEAPDLGAAESGVEPPPWDVPAAKAP